MTGACSVSLARSWQIKELQDEANRLGEEGEVDESMKKMTEVEALKVKKDGLENPHFPGMEEMEREREGFLIHMEEM